MSEIKKKLNAIIKDLDENINNKEELEYVKSQIYNVSLIFLEELDKLTETTFNRMNVMIDRQKNLTKKVTKMEKIIDNLEKEIFVPQEGDFEIVCPYCNTEFIEDLDCGIEEEIKCPECGNTIELDWNEEDSYCDGGCEGCHDCKEEDQEEYENNDESDEDDM